MGPCLRRGDDGLGLSVVPSQAAALAPIQSSM